MRLKNPEHRREAEMDAMSAIIITVVRDCPCTPESGDDRRFGAIG
jgi:hypothetical protein